MDALPTTLEQDELSPEEQLDATDSLARRLQVPQLL